MDLVHVSMSQHAKNLPAGELEQVLTDVLKIIKLIFEAHPKGAMDPPDNEDQGLEEYNKEEPLILRLFELNVAYLMVRYGEINLDPPMMAHVFSVL